MHWVDTEDQTSYATPDDVVDVGFKINCACLPLDHAYALAQALFKVLPWLREDNSIGIHAIHGAASGNGWYRPSDSQAEFLHVSRRTRLYLRLPKARVPDVAELVGSVIEIGSFSVEVGASSVRKLSGLTTLFSRHIVCVGDISNENEFARRVIDEARHMGITMRKLVCGLPHSIATPTERIMTRSLLVSGLSTEDSLCLQQYGIGPGRKLGCGLFVPYKAIDS